MHHLRRRRTRFFALALLVALVATAAFLAARPREPQPPGTSDELRVTSRPDANGTDDILVTYHAARAGVLVHYRLEDPRQPLGTPARVLAAWNQTEGQPHAHPLGGLPRLLVVTARPDEAGAPLAQAWVWHGRAHLIVAPGPTELARALQEDAP